LKFEEFEGVVVRVSNVLPTRHLYIIHRNSLERMEIEGRPAAVTDAGHADLLLRKTIEIKIEIFMLKEKKRFLLEELYRQFFEGEKEPKKRKRRDLKSLDVIVSSTDKSEISCSSNNAVSKKRKRRSSHSVNISLVKEMSE
jgi:hypothetical protein